MMSTAKYCVVVVDADWLVGGQSEVRLDQKRGETASCFLLGSIKRSKKFFTGHQISVFIPVSHTSKRMGKVCSGLLEHFGGTLSHLHVDRQPPL